MGIQRADDGNRHGIIGADDCFRHGQLRAQEYIYSRSAVSALERAVIDPVFFDGDIVFCEHLLIAGKPFDAVRVIVGAGYVVDPTQTVCVGKMPDNLCHSAAVVHTDGIEISVICIHADGGYAGCPDLTDDLLDRFRSCNGVCQQNDAIQCLQIRQTENVIFSGIVAAVV